MSLCANCLLDLAVHPPSEGDGGCPNCGQVVALGGAGAADHVTPVGPGASIALFGRFWATVRDVVFKPVEFFSARAESIVAPGGLSSALAFAVVVQWLASFFNFLWRSTIGVVVEQRLDDLFRIAGDVVESRRGMAESIDVLRDRALEFFFGAGAIVLTPFTTLLKLAMAGLFVHAATRFFIREDRDRPQTYAATLKILAYATAPWVLCVIPLFGMLLAWLLGFIVAVIGVREVYRTTSFRATVTVAFPEILLLGLLVGGLVAVLFLALNVMHLVF